MMPPKNLTEKLAQMCYSEDNEVDLNIMLKTFGSERLIGMLHAFVLLKPLLGKAVRSKEEQIVKVTDFAKFKRGIKEYEVGVKLDAAEVQERIDELH